MWGLKFAYFRNSHQSCSMQKSVLKSFAKLTRKHLCQSLFLIKLHAPEKKLWHRCLSVNFVKFWRTFFSLEHLHWLLLFILFMEGRFPNSYKTYAFLIFLVCCSLTSGENVWQTRSLVSVFQCSLKYITLKITNS